MNTINILGNATKELELKTSENGIKYTNFSLASNFTDGNKKQVTYFDIIAFGNTAKYLVKYLKNCGKINIQGICITNKYKNKEGKTKEKMTVKVEKVTIIDFKINNETPDNSINYSESFGYEWLTN